MVVNLILGQFHLGFTNQSISQNDAIWNFLSMVLSVLTFSLTGGSPGHQLTLSTQGDSDAVGFIIGMIVGVAFADNFLLTSSGSGVSAYGFHAVVVGFVFAYF